MQWERAPDVQAMINRMVRVLEMDHIHADRVIALRSTGSKANAIARIWPLERAWQKALVIPAYYLIEVLSEEFDKLPEEEKEKTVIHELLHIPKTFSGSVVPHSCFGRSMVDGHKVNALYKRYKTFMGD